MLRAASLGLVLAVAVVAAGGLVASRLAPDAQPLPRLVAAHALPLDGDGAYTPLLDAVGDGSVVLLGEETHGTREFHRERARITHRLLAERGFGAVSIEAEWGDARALDAYVRGGGAHARAGDALATIDGFPAWVWANESFRAFLDSLRARNRELPAAQRIGVYGLDMQDIFASIDAVVADVGAVDPAAAARARAGYACFERWRASPEAYGSLQDESGGGCAGAAESVLAKLERRAARWPAAVHGARAVVAGERFHRARREPDASAWNLRDEHMADTVDAVAAPGRGGRRTKVVAWAHNTHVGDARGTDLHGREAWSLGELLRQRHGHGAVTLVGFTTHGGTVTAATAWGGPARQLELPPARRGSHGALFHAAVGGDFLLVLRGNATLERRLAGERGQRAVGVVYDPGTERTANYVTARLSRQFDAVVHVDRSRAVVPLRGAPQD